MSIESMPDFRHEAELLFEETVRLRRDFHRHPELGFQERRTAAIVADYLHRLGAGVQTGVGQTGVVGLLGGDYPGPTVLLRFDMDALPIGEQNRIDYASQNPGVMHACGHDGHTAMGLTIAKIMSRYRNRMAGCLKVAFQPAEEGLGGAFAMIADGLLEDPVPDVALAMHLWNHLPLGKVRVAAGPCMASSSVFSLTIHGKGGHGAAPHQAVDPLLAAAHIIAALQSIVSRNVDPQDSVVVTVGQMRAGSSHNTIPDQALLTGTVRSYDDELHRLIYRRILEMAQNMATAFSCTARMETVAIVPAVVNDAAVTEVVYQAAAAVAGSEQVIGGRDMASEDMGYMLEEIPGCYFFIGSGNEAKGLHFPHHHPRFDFDERAMIYGVATMAYTAAHYLLDTHIVA
jgi:amidohydrolase